MFTLSIFRCMIKCNIVDVMLLIFIYIDYILLSLLIILKKYYLRASFHLVINDDLSLSFYYLQ